MTPEILYRDNRVLVLDKPAGLKVHPGPGGGPSVEDWFPALRLGRRDGPWLAHRLDADTSGCLVIARTKTALRLSQDAFARGAVRKTYWAVVAGDPKAGSGTVRAKLLKRTTRAGWRMVVDAAGQDAVSDWRVLGRAPGMTWLELSPRTGRTHQLRVHCAHLGCPIVGDAVYGAGGAPLHLMSRAIALPFDPPVAAVAPPPPHMHAALRACGAVTTA